MSNLISLLSSELHFYFYEKQKYFLAKVKAKTFGEGQTAVHYAAKNDALGALKVLTKFKCDLELQDYKKRTPIHVAAELGNDFLLL